MVAEKRIGFFISAIGIITILYNIPRLIIMNYSFKQILLHPSINISAIATITIISFSCSKLYIANIINQYLQVSIFFVIATIGIFDDIKSWYGLGLFALSIMLAIKYKMFKKYKYLKMFLLTFYIITVVELSVIIHNGALKGFGFEIVIFLVFFFGMMFLCYYDDLNLTLNKLAAYKKEHALLKEKVSDEQKRMDELKKYIDELERDSKTFDLSSVNLTKTELIVLEHLVNYRATNSEIADHFGKSEDTVKTQMKKILDKLGANDRYHAIELCRNNFK